MAQRRRAGTFLWPYDIERALAPATANQLSTQNCPVGASGQVKLPGRRTGGVWNCPVADTGAVSDPGSEPAGDPARETALEPAVAGRLKRNADGLVAAIVQQHDTHEVLMLGWMDDEALRRTLATGRGTYWSRSRQEYWVKGETSGHTQRVVEVRLDCDGDTVLVKVDQTGPACHTGAATCFDADVLLPNGHDD